jgi:TolB protein
LIINITVTSMIPVITLLLSLFVNASACDSNTTDIFTEGIDIGNPKHAGSAVYSDADQSYTIKGSGYNIWFARDEFYFLFNRMKGDFILTANFEFPGKGTEPHRKTGWMIRESADEDASHISATIHGDGLTVLQWRDLKGSAMKNPGNQITADSSGFSVLQLERKGRIIIMRAARKGDPLITIGSHEMDNLSGEVLAGIYICSHNPDVTEEAKAWNVRIDKPAGNDISSGKPGYPGSRLEIMNINDIRRFVIYEKSGRFEAPNWMPDGKSLLFNMEGSLFTLPVTGGEPKKLDTGFANRINNDHGISFNGKLLAISHQRNGMPGGGSTVYVLPLKGGVPRIITEETPSYWHGWAPNNREVIYVAQRGGKQVFNIYRNSIKGGKEIALTDINPGEHVDGCEYSPDGKYIYYNGNHNGTMHIWRMKPDGTGREQLTFDKYNDWFPHVSPDGRWIVLISFPPETDPNSHPAYKHVMLRIMPASGGKPSVLAYLYGGQGTINVPSWSPDSKRIAFVSNSGN